jgi:hypothetical protein
VKARWNLGTCSYARFQPEMGVPIRTSVGAHPKFRRGVVFLGAFAPFGVFGAMKDEPMAVQHQAYIDRRLIPGRERIELRLDELTDEHPGERLVLLCWCVGSDWYVKDCHRRWAAAWLHDEYGIEVPEIGA